jgi:hypothetical protein
MINNHFRQIIIIHLSLYYYQVLSAIFKEVIDFVKIIKSCILLYSELGAYNC